MPAVSQNPLRSPEEIQKLYDVIDTTTPDRLRTLLKDLSRKTPSNWDQICSALMLRPGTLKRAWSHKEEGNQSEEDSGQNESEYSDEQADRPANRRRFEICDQCDKEYDTLLNDKKSYVWHEGEMEVDWDGDFWADHDEQCHGEIDCEALRVEYPDGFRWTCCDKTGEAEGCKVSRHRPNRVKRMRR